MKLVTSIKADQDRAILKEENRVEKQELKRLGSKSTAGANLGYKANEIKQMGNLREVARAIDK